MANKNSPKHVVILMHGIQSSGAWQHTVRKVLNENKDTLVEVANINIGYVGYLEPIIPYFFRSRAVAKVEKTIRLIKAKYGNADYSVIAHSYGTYCISKCLERNADFVFRYVILCGGIVSRSFQWRLVMPQIIKGLINDCGNKDCVPAIASASSWGLGETGSNGIGFPAKDRFFDFGHSGFFHEDFIRKYWAPLILKDECVESVRDKEPFAIVRFLGSYPILKYVMLLVFVYIAFLLSHYIPALVSNIRISYLAQATSDDLKMRILDCHDASNEIKSRFMNNEAERYKHAWLVKLIRTTLEESGQQSEKSRLNGLKERSCAFTAGIKINRRIPPFSGTIEIGRNKDRVMGMCLLRRGNDNRFINLEFENNPLLGTSPNRALLSISEELQNDDELFFIVTVTSEALSTETNLPPIPNQLKVEVKR